MVGSLSSVKSEDKQTGGGPLVYRRGLRVYDKK